MAIFGLVLLLVALACILLASIIASCWAVMRVAEWFYAKRPSR